MVQVGELDEIVLGLVVEGYETLDQRDRDLLVREENPSSRGRRASAVCAIYTNEGSRGFAPQAILEGPRDVVGTHAAVAGEENEAEAEPAPAPTPDDSPADPASHASVERTG
jgi:hypothetical protein